MIIMIQSDGFFQNWSVVISWGDVLGDFLLGDL